MIQINENKGIYLKLLYTSYYKLNNTLSYIIIIEFAYAAEIFSHIDTTMGAYLSNLKEKIMPIP